MKRGLEPSFAALSLSAPCSTRHFATGKWPFWAAMRRGLAPLFMALSLSAPCSTRHWTTGKWPFWAAMKIGLAPSFMTLSLSAPWSSRYWTTLKWPFWAAIIKGVQPSPSPSSLLTPSSTRKRTESTASLLAAARRASRVFNPFLISNMSFSSLSVGWGSCKNCTTATWLFWVASINGVRPCLSASVLLTPSSTRNRTAAKHPLLAAARSASRVFEDFFVNSIVCWLSCTVLDRNFWILL